MSIPSAAPRFLVQDAQSLAQDAQSHSSDDETVVDEDDYFMMIHDDT